MIPRVWILIALSALLVISLSPQRAVESGNPAGTDRESLEQRQPLLALETEDVRELFNAVPVGTPVTIQP